MKRICAGGAGHANANVERKLHRGVHLTERRTAVDFAHQPKWLVEEGYPEAEIIRVGLDQLNIHPPASLHEAFAAEEARRIPQRLEFHYTPKHASWLNLAEIEFSVRNGYVGGLAPLPVLISAR